MSSTRLVSAPAWWREWRDAERVVQAAFGHRRTDWGSLLYAARVGIGGPLLRLLGRWRCTLCGAPFEHDIDHHECAVDW